MGLRKRPYYKPERRPARTKGVIRDDMAPLACPDAHQKEIAMALYSLAKEADCKIGRAAGYDNLKDEYTVVGKSFVTGKAQDIKIKGDAVAVTIELFRTMNGGRVTEPNRRLRRAQRKMAG